VSLPLIVKKMWRASLLLAAGSFCACLLYAVAHDHELNLSTINQALAGSATFMIGASFAMSGIGYYFDFLDSKIAYRKYMGIVGLWLAMAHAVLLAYLKPNLYWHHLFDRLRTADVQLGLWAMLILWFMFIVSRQAMIQRLGALTWRRCLRTGYLAYTLLIVRAMITEGNTWTIWWSNLHGLPPPQFIFTVFAVAVIIFRGSMLVVQFIRKHQQAKNIPLPN
jgi:hypothetical protein